VTAWPLALGLALGTGGPRPMADARNAAGDVLEALETWDLPLARSLLTELERTDGDSTVFNELRGRERFFSGDYAAAAQLLQGTDDPYAALAASTLAESANDEQRQSAHFVLLYPRGKDEILAPYALRTLEEARSRIGQDLGFLPDEPIRVEILRDPSALSRLSSLTEEEIKASGTIALCKYNKLMVVSPRALVTGYPWQDTLAHELTHYLITRESHNKTPIWSHEGIAKFEESRWRGGAGEALAPAAAALLMRRLHEGTLISFERMHPSIAKLPNQEDAALAFAEVFTTIEYLVKERQVSLQKLLGELRDGKSDTQAVELASGEPFDRMTRDWKAYLARRPMPQELLPLTPQKLKFTSWDGSSASNSKGPGKGDPAEPASREDTDPELSDIPDATARRFAHLGSLLLTRSRAGPALTELGKAESRAGARSPTLSNLYARALLRSGRTDEAERVLKASLVPYPDIAQTHVQLGQAELKAQQLDLARDQFLDANAIDPFDVQIHDGLLTVARAQGDAPTEAQESDTLSRLQKN
jgi:tetratricopeptide (TPR) repeat protein